LDGPSKAVVEACWNWGLIHDELEELEQVEEVVLAHPYKTRLIADAQIKTDRLDAYALGTGPVWYASCARLCARMRGFLLAIRDPLRFRFGSAIYV
jgi:hypothetical protein